MRIRSYLGLFGMVIATILTVIIQNSCIEEIPQEIEKQQQDNRSDQDSIVPPTPQDSIVPSTPQDSIVQTPLPDSTMTIAAFLEAYTAYIDISDFTYILKHSDMWDALSQDSGFTCFVPTNDAIRYMMNPDSLEASQNNTSVETLPDSICTIIARRHLVRDIIQLSSLKEDDGDFNWNNLLGEPIPPLTMLYDTVQYDSDQLNVRARYLFGSSIVIMLDMPVANGMLQFLDRAFPDPLNMN
jgi:hypothetical protein